MVFPFIHPFCCFSFQVFYRYSSAFFSVDLLSLRKRLPARLLLTSWLGLPFLQFHNINFITKEKHLQNLGPANSVILLLLHSSEVTSYHEFVHHQQVLLPEQNRQKNTKNFAENIKNQIASLESAWFNFHLRTKFLLSQFLILFNWVWTRMITQIRFFYQNLESVLHLPHENCVQRNLRDKLESFWLFIFSPMIEFF